MPSLLLTVFILQLVIHIVNSVGVGGLNELAWLLYNKLPTSSSKAYNSGRAQRANILRLKHELSSVSAQDDFAKWARIRRQHDKAVADYDKTANALKTSKATFDTTINSVRWLATNGLRLFLQYWYARKPIFWLPRGWLPGYAEWLLSFPAAPKGSISIQVWGIACSSVIAMATEVVVATWALKTGPVRTAPQAHAFTADKKSQ